MNLEKLQPKKVNLKKFTTIKIGGEAENFFVVDTIEQLQAILKKVDDFYVLGGGSNILAKDSVIKKPIIKLGESFNYIKKDSDSFQIGAATPLSKIINFCIKNNLGGIENLVGIPANLGGLLAMNASAFGKEISFNLLAVEIIDKDGNLKKLDKKDILFSYRTSSLKKCIVLKGWFALAEDKDLPNKIRYFLKTRLSTQDFSFPSCGCIFKNPLNYSAGFLIESCGLKGLSRNDAQISVKHANFIINKKNAKYKDVDYLINLAKEKVYKKFGIVLEEEIERWS